MTAASHEVTRRSRDESDDIRKPRLDSSWVTMCTSIFPDRSTIVWPMPSSKMRAHLGGVVLAGEIQQGRGHVVADHGMHRSVKAVREFTNLAHPALRRPGQPVTAYDVHHHQFGAGFRRDP